MEEEESRDAKSKCVIADFRTNVAGPKITVSSQCSRVVNRFLILLFETILETFFLKAFFHLTGKKPSGLMPNATPLVPHLAAKDVSTETTSVGR